MVQFFHDYKLFKEVANLKTAYTRLIVIDLTSPGCSFS